LRTIGEERFIREQRGRVETVGGREKQRLSHSTGHILRRWSDQGKSS